MSAQLQASDVLAKGMPARQLIEELAAAYPLMLVARTSDKRIEWISDGWQAALHHVPNLVGCNLRDIIARIPRPEQSFPIVTSLRKTGAVRHAPVDFPVGADAAAPFEVTAFPLKLCADEPRIIVMARRRHAFEPAAPPTSLIECHPDAVIAIDPHGFIDYANRAATALLATSVSQLVGSAAAVLACDTEGMTRLVSSLDTDVPREIRLAVRRDGAEPLPVLGRIAPHRGPDGEPLGAILSLRSAADEQKATSDLAHRNEELEHCINSLAHDLRSPLVALLGFSRLLHQDYGEQLDDTGVHFVNRIEQAGHTMEDLIHNLLELSRIGQPGEHPTLIDPRTVLLQLAAEFKVRLDEEGIRLNLPASPPLVYCDRTRLYQVFCNLIGNAVEHMGECAERRIDVTIEAEPGWHHIRVCDAGRGVPTEHHDRIFEAFQSLGARRDGRRGTGMGLAIVRKIAETRGGRAWVESDQSTGAMFHVTLPQP
ncbi:MAG: PAS domain-containing sensor histidine kinase [Deltaproteobacteria bacterium]|nr:PAS domain-containing sensor histidine kinase [Deltaproteobacteria bacterium]MBW2360240.1 PAS domain-containing sensor histidine kinase [Deltaproteobacteria bacterium]